MTAAGRASWPVRVVAGIAILAAAGAALARVAAGSVGSSLPFFTLVVVAYLVVGVLIIERRRANAVGPILFAMGLLIAAYSTIDLVIRQPDPPAGAAHLAWLVSLMDAPLFAMVAFLFLLFPDGHLPSPRWRWVGLAVIAFGTVSMVCTAVIPGPFPFYPEFENPFGLAGTSLVTIASAFYLLTIACVVAAVLSLVGRWRIGGPLERAQLKWVTTAAVLIAAVMVAYATLFGPRNFNDVADLAVGIALGFFPIAIGIAVLRYRLYEIDRLISRTIGWIVVTAVLAAVFGAVVVGLQVVLEPATGNNTLAVAASTLVVAALFQPLRGRVQQAVDRRFNRARVDAQRAIDAFGAHLRDDVDLLGLRTALVATADEAVRPASATIWLRGAEHAR
jgi:hypothetical protein